MFFSKDGNKFGFINTLQCSKLQMISPNLPLTSINLKPVAAMFLAHQVQGREAGPASTNAVTHTGKYSIYTGFCSSWL